MSTDDGMRKSVILRLIMNRLFSLSLSLGVLYSHRMTENDTETRETMKLKPTVTVWWRGHPKEFESHKVFSAF